jgi:hypothetical protein
MTKKLVIGLAFGTYNSFIPIFISSIFLAYPEEKTNIFVKIISDNIHNKKLNKALDVIRNNITSNFELIDYNEETNLKEMMYVVEYGRYYRYLLDYENVKGYDYAFITDIDSIFINKGDELFYNYIEHMKKTNISFSNQIRRSSFNTEKPRLNCNHHFIDVEKYFSKYNDINKYYRLNTDKIKEFQMIDEQFLYYIMDKEEISILRKNNDLSSKEIGIHLGIYRRKRDFNFIESDIKKFTLNKIKQVINNKSFIKINKINYNRPYSLFIKELNKFLHP